MKNRIEMKEMNLEQVNGGFTLSDLLFRKDQKITIEHAIQDTDKKPEIVPLGKPKTTTINPTVKTAIC